MKRRYACWVVGIVSNYADHVLATSVIEARKIYAAQRGCHVAHVEAVPA